MADYDIKQALAKVPVLGIIRHPAAFNVVGVFSALSSAGLPAVEITYDTPDVLSMITEARASFADRLIIGCGTVVSAAAAEQAIAAGAQFIVAPVVDQEVIEYCNQRSVPVVPGALTPTEIWTAHTLGAAMVKVFPAGSFGPSYFRQVLGPLAGVRLMAVGGVSPENAVAYLENGASAVAIGSSTLKREWIEQEEFGLLTEAAATVVACSKKK